MRKDELISMRAAAELLSAVLGHPHTYQDIRGLVRRGRLAAVRDGHRVRIRRDALAAYAVSPVPPRRRWTLP